MTVINVPRKYEPIRDFVYAMIAKIEASEEKYGDWRDITDASIKAHLEDEINEWDLDKQSTTEMVDCANLFFMLWCITKNPDSWKVAWLRYMSEHIEDNPNNRWPAYRYE